MDTKQATVSLEARDIHLPRVKRIKQLIDTKTLTEFFKAIDDSNGERCHWMLVYALQAAFDADITREAFCELASEVLNLRSRLSTCKTLEAVTQNHACAQLTPELLTRSISTNQTGALAGAGGIARMLELISECRGQDDHVH